MRRIVSGGPQWIWDVVSLSSTMVCLHGPYSRSAFVAGHHQPTSKRFAGGPMMDRD